MTHRTSNFILRYYYHLLGFLPFFSAANQHGDNEFLPHGSITPNYDSRQAIAEYYLRSEVDFLARQSMKLGGFDNYSHATNSNDSVGVERQKEHDRFLFTEKSLQLELNYIRSLRAIKAKESDVKSKGPTIDFSDSSAIETLGEKHSNRNVNQNDDQRESFYSADLLSFSIDAIRGATFTSFASLYEHRTSSKGVEQQYNGENDLQDYDFNMAEMHIHLQCKEHAENENKPLYTAAMYQQLWKTFHEFTYSSFPIPTKKETRLINSHHYVDDTKSNRGRGVFALHDITNGTFVYSGHPNTVFFLDADSFYRFVEALPSREMACDVLEWAWMQDVIPDSGNRVLCLNMDGGAFTNHGGEIHSNIELMDKTSFDFYAKRDIAKGEEILYDYFYHPWNTEEMDLHV